MSKRKLQKLEALNTHVFEDGTIIEKGDICTIDGITEESCWCSFSKLRIIDYSGKPCVNFKKVVANDD